MPITKVEKLVNTQMEHPIPSLTLITHTHTHTHTNFDWALYNSNIFELLKINPNLMYHLKLFKFIV
jgi:hypothetical protein